MYEHGHLVRVLLICTAGKTQRHLEAPSIFPVMQTCRKSCVLCAVALLIPSLPLCTEIVWERPLPPLECTFRPEGSMSHTSPQRLINFLSCERLLGRMRKERGFGNHSESSIECSLCARQGPKSSDTVNSLNSYITIQGQTIQFANSS